MVLTKDELRIIIECIETYARGVGRDYIEEYVILLQKLKGYNETY